MFCIATLPYLSTNERKNDQLDRYSRQCSRDYKNGALSTIRTIDEAGQSMIINFPNLSIH